MTCCLVSGFTQNAGAVNLVVNGGFETTTNGTNKQLARHTDVTGWTSGTSATPFYNFVVGPGAADTTGVLTKYNNQLYFWGAANGGTSTIPLSSPDGGNYIAADGDFEAGPITQQLSGLTVGAFYDLNFWWAVGQQTTYEGDITEKFQVSLGGQTFSTPIVSMTSKGFIPWMAQKFTFQADSATPILSFLSVGTPTGQPPFAMLDGVSLEAVPEPSTSFIGALMVGGLILRRQRRNTPT